MYDPAQPTRNSFARFFSETTWALASSVAVVLSGFVLSVLLGNVLGPDGFGVYVLAATIFMLATTLAEVGLSAVVTKYSAEFIDQTDVGRQYYTAGLLIVSVATLVAGTLVFALRHELATMFKMPELTRLLAILALGIPFYGLNKVAIGRLNGLRQMGRMAFGEILRSLLMVVLTVLGAAYLRGGMVAAIWALALTEILLFPVLFALTRLHRGLDFANLGQRCRALASVGGQIVLARIIADLDQRLGVLLVGAFLTQAELGAYGLAVQMTSALRIWPVALAKVVGPTMAEMYAKGRTRALENLLNQTMSLTAYVLALIAVAMVMFFPQIVGLLYPGRPGFLLAESPFLILAFPAIFQGVIVSVGLVFISVNRPGVVFKINLARLAVNGLLGLILIQAFRTNGAAWSQALTVFFIFILRTWTMSSIADVRTDYKPLILIPLLGALSVLVGYVLSEGVWASIAKIGLWTLFALVVMRLWHFEQYVVRLYRMVLSLGFLRNLQTTTNG